MKKLSTYLFLILFSFSAPSFADDIQDLEIERISIGDNLLDHFNIAKIQRAKIQAKALDLNIKSISKFETVFFEELKFKTYDQIVIFFKDYDKRFKSDANLEIHSIGGFVYYDTNMDKCYKKQNEIDKELSKMFFLTKRYEFVQKHIADKSGKSTYKLITHDFKNGGGSHIVCTKWSKEMNYSNFLAIYLDSKEFREWLFPGGCGGGLCYNMR